MLEEMDAGHLAEWKAFNTLQDEAFKRAELAGAAQAGVRNYKRGGR